MTHAKGNIAYSLLYTVKVKSANSERPLPLLKRQDTERRAGFDFFPNQNALAHLFFDSV
jgi:hypothetical protein